jgi:hypothetical protein
MLESAHAELLAYIEEYKKANPMPVRAPAPVKKAEKKDGKITKAKASAKKEALKPISEQLNNVLRGNNELLEPHIDEFCSIVKKITGMEMGDRKSLATMHFKNFLIPLVALNEHFENSGKSGAAADSGMFTESNGKNPLEGEDAMKAMVTKCFQSNYENIYMITGIPKGSEASVAVVQAFTNYIMKNFSPAKTEPERYGKYADNYVVKNDKLLTELTQIDAESASITKARAMLNVKAEDIIKEPDAMPRDKEKAEAQKNVTEKANYVDLKQREKLTVPDANEISNMEKSKKITEINATVKENVKE